MKKIFVLLGCAGLLTCYLAQPGKKVERLSQAGQAEPAADPIATFQKAFWKRPTAQDRILNASQRQWQAADGCQHWQWFISVQASPTLVQRLITDNAFLLTASHQAQPLKNAPDWFTTATQNGKLQLFSNALGTYQLHWDAENQLLHATDSGSGFSPGTSNTAALAQNSPAPPNTPAGRLPNTHPPRPQD
jgi:hypothetical protein